MLSTGLNKNVYSVSILNPMSSLFRSHHYFINMFQDYDTEDINFMKHAIMDQWDLNHDGKINKGELTMLLLQQGRMALEEDDDASMFQQDCEAD